MRDKFLQDLRDKGIQYVIDNDLDFMNKNEIKLLMNEIILESILNDDLDNFSKALADYLSKESE